MLHSAIHGWYSGKGFKSAKHGNHEKALKYYFKSLKYCENIGSKAYLYECIAIAYIRLSNPQKAKAYAQDALEIYESSTERTGAFADGEIRVNALIKQIKNS